MEVHEWREWPEVGGKCWVLTSDDGSSPRTWTEDKWLGTMMQKGMVVAGLITLVDPNEPIPTNTGPMNNDHSIKRSTPGMTAQIEEGPAQERREREPHRFGIRNDGKQVIFDFGSYAVGIEPAEAIRLANSLKENAHRVTRRRMK